LTIIDSQEEEEIEEDIGAITEEEVTDADENTSTLLALIHRRDKQQTESNIQEDTSSQESDNETANEYAKAYYSVRRPFTPVKGRSVSAQFEFLSEK
jgi:hypothetical protein